MADDPTVPPAELPPPDPRDPTTHPYWRAYAERLRRVDPGPQSDTLVIEPRAAAPWPARTWTPAERVSAGMMNTLRDELNELHAQGLWTDYTPTLTAVGGTGGTATLNTLYTCRFMTVGKTLFVEFYFVMTLSAAPTYVTMSFPAGVSLPANYTASAFIDTTGFGGMVHTRPDDAGLHLYRDTGGTTPWPTGARTPAGMAICALR